MEQAVLIATRRKNNKVERSYMLSHVVILGAGATIAAIPNGDKNGIKSPAMKDFFIKTHMEHLLDGFEIKTPSTNLEDIYSELYENPKYKDKLGVLDDAIYDYFSKLKLPDEPTIYDLLILGLTKDDLIATFNWDPLLIQAYERCYSITDNLPKMAFLHGNVALGYCPDCLDYGDVDNHCPTCGKKFERSKLLFPIKNKDYNNHELIKGFWKGTQDYIRTASMITVFGYGAPSSDVEAIKLFKSAWGALEDRNNEEFSFINIEDEETCIEKWKDFVYTHHYRYSQSFYDSYIAMFPRRSCQVEFATHHGNISHRTDLGFKQELSFEDLMDMTYPLLCEEAEEEKLTSHYYVRPNQFN